MTEAEADKWLADYRKLMKQWTMCVAGFQPGDADGMTAAILALADDPLRRESAIASMRDVVRDAAWEREAERYVAIVERLTRA